MKNQTITYSSLALLLAATLSACGGGGGSPGTVGGTGSGTGTGTGSTPAVPATPATPTVGVSFANGNSLSGATPLTVRAVVLDANKQPLANAVVTFTTDAGLGAFTPGAGTALTDATGTASITLRAASLAAGGAGKVTATTSVAGAAITGEANYSVNATSLKFSELTLTPVNGRLAGQWREIHRTASQCQFQFGLRHGWQSHAGGHGRDE
jgi:hypothetical protein